MVEIEKDRLVMESNQRPHYSLNDLLSQCDDSADISQEDQEWLNNKPINRELL